MSLNSISRRTAARALVAVLAIAAASGTSAAQTAVASAAEASPRPGDRVLLRIWDEPAMSDTFTVTETGEVTLPRLGVVPVTDREIATLQDSLRSAYAEFLRNPSVEVRILRRVAAVGEVKQPGIYWIDLTMNVPDLIARAGGFTEAGDPNEIWLVRGPERIRFTRAMGERLMSAELRSGDQVLVGQRGFFARNPLAAISSTITIIGYFVTVILPAL